MSSTIGKVSSAAAATAAQFNRFSAFSPSRIQMYRDGGTIKLEGLFNRSVSGTVRFDGAIGSKTRGQFFVTSKHFMRPAEPEKKMTTADVKALKVAVQRYMKQHTGESPYYATLLKDIDVALKPKPAFSPAKVPTAITGPNAGAQVETRFWADLMPGPRVKKAIATVTVSGTGFNDAPPNYKVGSIAVYEQGTNKKVAVVKNPPVESSENRRGLKSQTYRLELPLSDVNQAKKYTFVTSTQINGAKAQLVRSDYVALAKVH